MKNNIVVFVFLWTVCTSINAQEKTANPFSIKWDNGFKVENADKSIKLKFGGRIMYDMGFFSLNDEAETNGYTLKSSNGTELRRARFFTSGTIYKNVDFKLQVDFAGGEVTLKDAFITLKKLPVGNLRVGHFKEPFRLEALTSSKYFTFMERATLISMLDERSSGAMLFDQFSNKKMSWQIGVFRGADASSDKKVANGDYAVTARVAGLVLKEDQNLVHLGFGYSYRKPQEDHTYGYKVRPETHISNKYIVTSVLDVDNINLMNVEAAWVANSFSLQGEFLKAKVNAFVDQDFSSYYLQASYFITGEKRVYKNSLVGFGRVKPLKNFGDNGYGALQVALRYSYIDGLNSDQMSNVTAGINWHLNPATRVMVNYVISNIENTTDYTGNGQFSAFQMRFQIDF
ncbi:MAG: hypothetical protein COB60_08450 [Flavobacteriaceae bacterium]|nr:MAG: hypothetical protein COB60_08450 [Flavobacteriaceae bacterium]